MKLVVRYEAATEVSAASMAELSAPPPPTQPYSASSASVREVAFNFTVGRYHVYLLGPDGVEQATQGRRTGLEGDHALELVKTPGPVEAIPVEQGIERIEELAVGDPPPALPARDVYCLA